MYVHGLVTEIEKGTATVKVGVQMAKLGPEDFAWTEFTRADRFLVVGDVVYVRVEASRPDGSLHLSLQQDSGAQGSLMAVDNSNGEVLAMVGGRDFAVSQFNRATQSQRQVGSSFKPYVYATAIEDGAKPTDIVVDGPTSFPTPSGWYTPHNYEGDYRGAMTLLSAFAESRNIPALKLANKAGIRRVIQMAQRFGVTSNLPAFLPVAIGAADLTLAEQVGAYSVFPNDGIRIEPHTIRKVTQADGLALPEKVPQVTEVISVETARTMMQLLEAVTRYGTGAAAAQLKHPLGGKTGTTNNYTDAWFVGFSPSVTCGTWIGFDDRQSLGEKETGAKAALPMWMDFMRAAIAGKPKEAFASAGAPKKVLDVPARSSEPEEAAPAAKDEDADPDAPAAQLPAPIERRSPAAPIERRPPPGEDVPPATVPPSVAPGVGTPQE